MVPAYSTTHVQYRGYDNKCSIVHVYLKRVFPQTGTQAAAVASVLQEPADKFENDVRLLFSHFCKCHKG